MARYIVTPRRAELKRVAKALQSVGVATNAAAAITGLHRQTVYLTRSDDRIDASELTAGLQSHIDSLIRHANEMADA